MDNGTSNSQEINSSNSNSDHSDSQSSSSSSHSVDVSKFGEKHEEWAKGIMRGLREEWKQEDEMLYLLKPERESLQ